MSTINAVPNLKFTDEVIGKNFAAIAGALVEFETWSEKVDGQLAELIQKASKKPSKIKPFFLGAVVGVVVYRAYKQNSAKVDAVVETATEKVKETANNYEGVLLGNSGKTDSDL